MAALALTFAACSNDDNDLQSPAQQPAKAEGIPFSASISIDNGAATRALMENGTTLEASWAVGEKVALIHNGVSDEMEVKSVSGGVATIKGTITGSPSDGDDVTIIYPSTAADGTTGNVKSDLLYAQDGTLATVASTYEARKSSGAKLKVVSGTASLNGNVSLTNQFAIWKLTLGSAAKNLRVLADNATIAAATLATAGTNFTIAVPDVSSKTVTIVASDESKNCYYYSKASVTLVAGKYYQSTPTMTTIAGAIGGLFSVNASKKVFFSKGNLRFTSSAWSFFDNQYDYYQAHSPGAWDKFGWSTSTTNYGMRTSTTASDYYGDLVDWGATMGTGWRTLTSAEWAYLFNTRKSGSTVFGTENARYTQATINTDVTGVNGVILFPDGVTIAETEVSTAGTVNGISAWGTQCTTAQWTDLEAKGCVFLPAAGYRYGSQVFNYGGQGLYWSCTVDGTFRYNVFFGSGELNPERYSSRLSSGSCNGYSVRLVRGAE